MITGAAGATINRLPVLLLPGDIFANRAPAPVLQQLESPQTQDVSVNDCFRPVSRYWDRIYRPGATADRAAGSDARADVSGRDRRRDAGAATGHADRSLRLSRRVLRARASGRFARQRGDAAAIARAAEAIRASQRAVDHRRRRRALQRSRRRRCASFAEATGIAVAETQAGKSAISWDHPLALGAHWRHGDACRQSAAREADLVIAIGTRLARFHDDVEHGVRASGCAVRRHQRVRDGCVQAARDSGRGRCARGASRSSTPRSRGYATERRLPARTRRSTRRGASGTRKSIA